MEKLNSTNNICQTCNGNGYIKVTDEEINIHQCWKCNSKGEYNAVSLENSHLLDDDEYWNFIPRSIPKLR